MLGEEVALADLDFLFQSVAADVDDFHAVPQRGLNGAQVVARGEEHDLAQVVIEVEVVVVEGVVLLWIEDFEQGRGGVSVVVAAELVNLIQHKQRVAGARLLQVLKHAARHRPDVGFSVTADFGFVA